jgi:hypothetical protein
MITACMYHSPAAEVAFFVGMGKLPTCLSSLLWLLAF